MASSIVSKNLFNFKMLGEIDPDAKALADQQEEMRKSSPEAKEMEAKLEELSKRKDPESCKEYAEVFRAMVTPMIAALTENKDFAYGGEQTNTTFIKVPTTHDGEFDVPVEVYTPKCLEEETKRAAYIHAHGGGAIALTAVDVRKVVQCTAVDLDAVTFNVDYRLAPETKCPNNIKDFYEVIKYVSKNAESLGIDPAKIVIGGESGGGYICLGAMVLLAENNETNLVKLAVPAVPMVDDYCFSDPLVMTKEERETHTTMRKIWRDLIAADFEEQKSSPHLFPGKASEDLLEKFPNTIILESEFDMFITQASRLANRLRRAGRLLEFVVIPGGTHMSSWVPGTRTYKDFTETIKTIATEYIHS